MLQLLHGLTEVDDVDGVALVEDERLHLWIPALCLVAKMHPGLEKFRHQFSGHRYGSGEEKWAVVLSAVTSEGKGNLPYFRGLIRLRIWRGSPCARPRECSSGPPRSSRGRQIASGDSCRDARAKGRRHQVQRNPRPKTEPRQSKDRVRRTRSGALRTRGATRQETSRGSFPTLLRLSA